jgi:LemA protein
MKIIAERKTVDRNSSAGEVDAQENALRNLTTQVTAIAEQYPNLKANENYAKAMDSVNTYENQVRMSRMVYNDSVTAMNRMVRQIPESLVAGPLGFKEKEYLTVEEKKTQMPSMKI